MINVTDSAVEKIKDLIAEQNNPKLKLRIFVQGGGCSGFSYGFTLDEEIAEDDWDLNINGTPILIDSASGQYLQGATINYRDDVYGSSFTVDNPNATTTCGCGSSFSPF
jgi:iron-sulfur cluster insertion protein